jgi:hypothetical protein
VLARFVATSGPSGAVAEQGEDLPAQAVVGAERRGAQPADPLATVELTVYGLPWYWRQ